NLPSSLFPALNDFVAPDAVIQLGGSQLPTITANVSIVAANDPYTVTIFGVVQPTRTLTISGQNQSRVFQVGTTGRLSLNNLIIEDGSTTGNGGGILNHGILSLEDVTLSGNKAASGGGIASTGPALTIDQSIITANKASVSGGGVWTSSPTVEFTQDTIRNNSVIGPKNSTVVPAANPGPAPGGSVEGGGLD